MCFILENRFGRLLLNDFIVVQGYPMPNHVFLAFDDLILGSESRLVVVQECDSSVPNSTVALFLFRSEEAVANVCNWYVGRVLGGLQPKMIIKECGKSPEISI